MRTLVVSDRDAVNELEYLKEDSTRLQAELEALLEAQGGMNAELQAGRWTCSWPNWARPTTPTRPSTTSRGAEEQARIAAIEAADRARAAAAAAAAAAAVRVRHQRGDADGGAHLPPWPARTPSGIPGWSRGPGAASTTASTWWRPRARPWWPSRAGWSTAPGGTTWAGSTCTCGATAATSITTPDLDGFAGGIGDGVRVNKGQTVGYVGDTGNAGVPHLHLGYQPAGGPLTNPYQLMVRLCR